MARVRITVERDDGYVNRVKAVELDGPDVWLTRISSLHISDSVQLRSSR